MEGSKIKILIPYLMGFVLLSCTFSVQAQQVGSPLQQAFEHSIPLTDFTLSFSPTTNAKADIPTPPPVASLLTAPIPKAYNYEHLGAFCKLEVQLEKIVRLPVKVRLGEVQYTEFLEYGNQLFR